MKDQAKFWFIHARSRLETVHVAVAAFTERQARIQARKRIGKIFTITAAYPIPYSHAWVLNHAWHPKTESNP